MSKELIDRLKSYIPSGDGHHSQYANDLADAVAILEAKAAPVGEREAFEAHMRIGGYSNPDKHPDGSYVSSAMELWWQGWKARSAYQRAQQPQSAEAVAYIPVDRATGEQWHPVKVKGTGAICDYIPLYTTPQPSAVPDARAFKDELLKATKWIFHPHIEGVFAVFMQSLAAPSAPATVLGVNQQLLEALEELMYAHTDKAEALATAAIAAARQEGGK